MSPPLTVVPPITPTPPGSPQNLATGQPAALAGPIGRPVADEAMLLGALLDADGRTLKSNAFDLAAMSGLVDADFSDPRVGLYWRIAVGLSERKRAVDAATVFMAAKSSGRGAEGDLAWMQSIQSRNTLSVQTFQQVAKGFRLLSRSRVAAGRLEALAKDLRHGGRDASNVSGQLTALAATLTSDWAPNQTAKSDAIELLAEWDLAGTPAGRLTVVRSGIEALDNVMRGWTPNLNLIIGQPSVGKSSLEAASIVAQLRAGMRVGLFGLEDGTKWLSRRFFAAELGIPVSDVTRERLTPEQADAVQRLTPDWYRLLDNLLVFKFSSITTSKLCEKSLDWIKNEHVGCVWVDHAGIILHDRSKGIDTREAISNTLLAIRAVAENNHIPHVVLMHTARPDQKDREERAPRMTEIAESAYAERHAFKIVGLWLKDGGLRATVLKNKEGRRDVTVALETIQDAAMVQTIGGREVDLRKEHREDFDAKQAEREARSRQARDLHFAENEARKAKAAAEKESARLARLAAAAAKKPEQSTLLAPK